MKEFFANKENKNNEYFSDSLNEVFLKEESVAKEKDLFLEVVSDSSNYILCSINYISRTDENRLKIKLKNDIESLHLLISNKKLSFNIFLEQVLLIKIENASYSYEIEKSKDKYNILLMIDLGE